MNVYPTSLGFILYREIQYLIYHFLAKLLFQKENEGAFFMIIPDQSDILLLLLLASSKYSILPYHVIKLKRFSGLFLLLLVCALD